MKGLKEFIEWMAARKLSLKTIKEYLIYYRVFERELGEGNLNQAFINNFVIRHKSDTAKAFVKNMLEFYDLKQFEVPKIRGRKARKIRKSVPNKDFKAIRKRMYEKKAYKYGLMLDLTWHDGLRREETCTISLIDFDLKLWAEDTSKSCRLKIHGKGNKERHVIVPPKLMMRIIKWVESRKNIVPRDRLFGVKGKRWHEIFKDVVRSLDMNYSLHDLRRTRGTKWINEIGINKAKYRLGHADIGTTQKYFNIDEEKEMRDWEQEY